MDEHTNLQNEETFEIFYSYLSSEIDTKYFLTCT